ncbi:hypothetical protein H5410_050418 [Solanum commersonii]|uniref:Uncharacterized protein n=1 Tax=Solanum commersonii TaxID=4109 RepID=A0A9J5WWR2_SOLCO|nr:hypothetical protein H5410_050418 [Solanum commersonii]
MITRSNKKSPAKKPCVKMKVASTLEPVMGPELERQKVLNGRVFDSEILTKPRMCSMFDYVVLQRWEHLFECPMPYVYEP